MKFIEFTGEESEKEFLEKCLKQWEIATNSDVTDMVKVMHIGTAFIEMRHRLNELNN